MLVWVPSKIEQIEGDDILKRKRCQPSAEGDLVDFLYSVFYN